MLNKAAHTRPRDSATTKDLDGIARSLLCTLRGVHLQETNLTVHRK